jgi:uroporphyrinogen-III decarboxylase
VWVFEVADNVDSLFYSPAYFREFCLPTLKKQAEMLYARGRYLFMHACGRLKVLAPLFLEAGLDCMEGQAVPPLGDWPLHEARALSPRLIVCGGMAAPEQELDTPDAAERLDAYVCDTFASMGDMRRFLFGSSCNTSPRTPYKNLLTFRDASWKYGRT